MPTVKKRLLAVAVVTLGILAFWYETRQPQEDGKRSSSGQRANGSTVGTAAEEGDSARLATKASVRHDLDAGATHRPERLKDFYLQEVMIDGLTLEAGLQKLQAAYEEACFMTGEVPLRLSFVVPPAKHALLHLKLGVGNLDASIRLLAAASALKVKREGTEYVFEAPKETGKPVKRSLEVPPDLLARLMPKGKIIPSSPTDLRQAFAAMGVELDSSTQLIYNPAWGVMTLDTTNAADETAVGGILDVIGKQTPVQHKLNATIAKLPADIEWTGDEVSQLDAGQVQVWMRILAQKKGVDLMTTPSITARDGELTKVDLTRDFIIPPLGSTDEYELHKVGLLLEATPSSLGFGHQVEMDFSVTNGDIDPESGSAVIREEAAIADTSYTRDGASRLHVQTHPDGTRTVMLVTPTLIDATGRPVRGDE